MAASKVAAVQMRLHMPPLAPAELELLASASSAGRTPVRVRGRQLYCEHLLVSQLMLAEAEPPGHIIAVATLGAIALTFT